MRILTLLFISCFFISCEQDLCGDKEKFMENFRGFLDETRSAASDYDKADWTKVEAKFEQLTKDCYQAHKDEMTSREKRKFWKDAVKLMVIKGTNDLGITINEDEIKDDDGRSINIEATEEDLQYIADELEDVFKDTGEELKEVIDEFLKEDASKLIDKAMDGLEKIADELKESLKEKK